MRSKSKSAILHERAIMCRFLVLLLVASASMHAQSNFATLSGRVQDPAQAPVSGARVTVTAKATAATRQTAANFPRPRVPVERKALILKRAPPPRSVAAGRCWHRQPSAGFPGSTFTLFNKRSKGAKLPPQCDRNRNPPDGASPHLSSLFCSFRRRCRSLLAY